MYRWANTDETEWVLEETTGHVLMEEEVPEGNDILTYWTKEQAAYWKDQETLQLNREANLADFTYEGDLYVADKESIQGTQNQCLAMDNAELIPTFEGQWVLKDDTVRVFTVLEFKKFAKAFYMRASNNFKVKKYHQKNIKQMLTDLGVTAEDIRSYDCTVGWV